MENLSLSTRYKKQSSNWYALAAVATALQLSIGIENEKNSEVFISNGLENCITDPTCPVLGTRIISLNYIDNKSITTLFTKNQNEDMLIDDENFTIRSKYLKEFKIEVGSLKIDRSVNKIFLD